MYDKGPKLESVTSEINISVGTTPPTVTESGEVTSTDPVGTAHVG